MATKPTKTAAKKTPAKKTGVAGFADRLMKSARNQYGGSRDRAIDARVREATGTPARKKK